MIKITNFTVDDVRFPTSKDLTGSDAIHTDPDYSATYVTVYTSDDNLKGFGLAFTIGKGNDIVAECIKHYFPIFVGKTIEEVEIIIFSPVYNGGFLAHLKNTLDWLSLSYSDKRYNALFRDKNVAVITSVRGLGGNAQAAFELLSAQLSNYSLKVFDEFHLITNKEHQNEELIEDNKEIFDDIKKFVFRFLDF